MRRTGSLLVCAGLVTSAPAGHATVTPVDVIVVDPGSRTTHATRFVTEAGRPYSVTVTGVFTWNRVTGLGLADCGHRDEGRPGPWANWIWLLLDGAPARCASMPVSDTHTYTWVETGTGEPFRFSVPSTADGEEDDGALVVTVTRAT